MHEIKTLKMKLGYVYAKIKKKTMYNSEGKHTKFHVYNFFMHTDLSPGFKIPSSESGITPKFVHAYSKDFFMWT